jgi:NNP family nitrate/nitrite transporter-like MFS transporter
LGNSPSTLDRRFSIVTTRDELGDQKQNATGGDESLLSQLSPLLFLASIFLINFTGRIIFAPLMPTIEKDISITHSQAGSLFFVITCGYFPSVLGAGFISSRLTHRKTIILSTTALGMALVSVSLCAGLWSMIIALLLVGMAAGFYLPSGIATLTSLIHSRHWGKAIAVHELAPNLGFVLAPLVSEMLLGLFSWRFIPALFGIISMAVGAGYARFGRGGNFPGEVPGFGSFRDLSNQPAFWIMTILFGLGIAGSFGIFTMLPLYLVSERGLESGWANTLIALSRVSCIGMSFLAGWATDRLGPKKTLLGVFFLTGLATVILGVFPYPWVVIPLFVQPMLAACFFPAGFAALSFISMARFRSLAVSLAVPLGFIFGGGAIPIGIGLMGDMGAFGRGVSIVGGLILLGTFLSHHLTLSRGSS